jgi:hypothetical protein
MAAATSVAVGGLLISAGSTAMSFIQADKQKKMQRAAEAEAAKKMAEARKKLEINYAKERGIKKEPYELQRDAFLSAGAQAIEAGVESERGGAVTAGKIQMAQNEAQGGVRTDMTKELNRIEDAIIDESTRNRDLGIQMDLGEVAGQQAIAADAQQAAAANEQAGYQGVASTLQQGLAMVPLFAGGGLKQGKAGRLKLSNEQFQAVGNVQGGSMGADAPAGFTNLDLDAVKGMSRSQFKKFKQDLTPEQTDLLTGYL